MPGLNDTFKAVGVTSARDKILALCNAPALFFNVSAQYSEDHILVHSVAYVVGGILADEVSPTDRKFHAHIRYGIFEQRVDARRNLMHSLADPVYLDAYIAGLKEIADKLNLLHADYLERRNNIVTQETGVPLMATLDLYRKYHAI